MYGNKFFSHGKVIKCKHTGKVKPDLHVDRIDTPQMAYGFILAAVTLLHGRVFLQAAGAGQMCDSANALVVGNNATREANAERVDISKTTLYLDIDNPAPCTGNITSWTICYYNNIGGGHGSRRRRSRSRRSNSNMTPQEDSRSILFAIYRSRSRQRYERVSDTFEFTVDLTVTGK